MKALLVGAALGLAGLGTAAPQAEAQTLLNVSHDPARELYREYNSFVRGCITERGGGGHLTTPTHADLPRRVRWAMHLVTARWHPPAVLPPVMQERLRQAELTGWLLRKASPRWDLILRPLQVELGQGRIVILPAEGFGMRETGLLALGCERLKTAGIFQGPTDRVLLRSLEHDWFSRIAGPWASCDQQTDPERRGGS